MNLLNGRKNARRSDAQGNLLISGRDAVIGVEMKKKVARFLSELGVLKLSKRTGWWYAGVKDPESVAEHSWRAAAVAYFLAREEGLDAEKLCTHAVFHDAPETRTGDLHKVASNYFKNKVETEARAEKDQWGALPKKTRLTELNEKERAVLKDADYLECALQALEYESTGYRLAGDWMQRVEKALKTESAKKLLAEFKALKGPWWAGLKEKV